MRALILDVFRPVSGYTSSARKDKWPNGCCWISSSDRAPITSQGATRGFSSTFSTIKLDLKIASSSGFRLRYSGSNGLCKGITRELDRTGAGLGEDERAARVAEVHDQAAFDVIWAFVESRRNWRGGAVGRTARPAPS